MNAGSRALAIITSGACGHFSLSHLPYRAERALSQLALSTADSDQTY